MTHDVYQGTIGEREYAHGRDEGRAAADRLAESGTEGYWPVLEADGWESVRASTTDRSRAYYLGWLRGFREVSR